MKTKTRSKRSQGVKAYALDLVQEVAVNFWPYTKLSHTERYKAILNWASNRKTYSRWWCSLIYNQDIAKRLCTE